MKNKKEQSKGQLAQIARRKNTTKIKPSAKFSADSTPSASLLPRSLLIIILSTTIEISCFTFLFKLGNLFYRKDRVRKPITNLSCKSIKNNMRWCNDINDSKNYNKLVKKKLKLRSEKLYRKDFKYNYLIIIEYNSQKRVLGKGSAIFIHLTKNYKPTAGCVALKEKDFLIMLKLIKKKSKIKIF